MVEFHMFSLTLSPTLNIGKREKQAKESEKVEMPKIPEALSSPVAVSVQPTWGIDKILMLTIALSLVVLAGAAVAYLVRNS